MSPILSTSALSPNHFYAVREALTFTPDRLSLLLKEITEINRLISFHMCMLIVMVPCVDSVITVWRQDVSL